MNTAIVADHGFAPTVPLLGAQGWIHAPASDEPAGLVELLREWLHRSRTRSDIAELDDHLLRDIGLSRESVLAESRKRFWQV
jgi:uncharacterized protein YjiS (DUF1127 family)